MGEACQGRLRAIEAAHSSLKKPPEIVKEAFKPFHDTQQPLRNSQQNYCRPSPNLKKLLTHLPVPWAPRFYPICPPILPLIVCWVLHISLLLQKGI